MEVGTEKKDACSMAMALWSTDLEKSVYRYFRNEPETYTYRIPSTLSSVISDWSVHVHFPFYRRKPVDDYKRMLVNSENKALPVKGLAKQFVRVGGGSTALEAICTKRVFLPFFEDN